MKIKYNSPVILSFALISILVFVVNQFFLPVTYSIFALPPSFDFGNPFSYFRLVSYIFGHANMAHLTGNLALILLIGPIVEEKYGHVRLLLMMAATAIITAFITIFFFHQGVLGASGIAFMLIILSSLTNFSKGEIPMTFILIFLIFIGKEAASSLTPDNISQSSHIAGGVMGSFFGLKFGKK